MTKDYMKAFMAKNLTELSQSAIIDKVDPNPKPKEEFIPLEDADESIFKKYLKNLNNGRQNELPEV